MTNQSLSELLEFNAKTIERNFVVTFEEERLWFRCRECGRRFPSDVDPKRLDKEIIRHHPFIPHLRELKSQFIIDKAKIVVPENSKEGK